MSHYIECTECGHRFRDSSDRRIDIRCPECRSTLKLEPSAKKTLVSLEVRCTDEDEYSVTYIDPFGDKHSFVIFEDEANSVFESIARLRDESRNDDTLESLGDDGNVPEDHLFSARIAMRNNSHLVEFVDQDALKSRFYIDQRETVRLAGDINRLCDGAR